jgi:hypothetical protein
MKPNYMTGIKEVTVDDYGIREGSFGVRTKETIYDKPVNVFNWYSCRDGYQSVYKSKITRNGIYFSHTAGDGDKVVLFLMKIEDKLKLQVRSKFRKTNLDYVTWIKISPWWLENKTRRSFLTLMLRMARDFNPTAPKRTETIENVASRSGRGVETLPAIKRFLRGFTICSDESPYAAIGWVNTFANIDNKTVKKLLVKQ